MRRTQFLLLAAAILLTGTIASAQVQGNGSDPGVARISIIGGDVSVQRGDSGERTAAAVNAPLMAGDVVDTGPGAHAEIQFDSSNMLRLAADSEVRLSELAAGRYQAQVGRGTVMFSGIRDSRAQVEISTPSISVRPAGRGEYRISVYDDGRAEITVRSGEADIYTPRGAEKLVAGRTMMVQGNPADPEFQIAGAIQPDEFDRWNENRDRDLQSSRSYRYVSPEINGAPDLDANGRWVHDPAYGQVWTPNVGPDWAPYQNGRWVWTDFYGWTWVDYDPWGWAPFHYGRWFWGSPGWCWYPGPVWGPHYWSPALVAFFGFGGFHVGVGFGGPGFGWVPLAPFEVFHPWWGRGFYGGYRDHNVLVNNINIANNVNIRNTYRNARVTNGVTVVNAHDFASGRLTNTMHPTAAQLQQASLVRGQVPIAPSTSSLRFSDRAVASPARNSTANSGRFFSHNQPAAVNRVPFAQQQQSLGQISRGGSAAASVPRGEITRPGAAGAMQSAPTGRAQNSTPQGWRSGEPAARTPMTSNPARPGMNAPADTGGWRRFGGPQQNSAATPSRNQGFSVTPSDGWRRYQPGADRPAYSTPRSESPRYQSPGYSRPQSLQIAPPIVRERSATPRSGYGGSSGYGGGGHSSGGGGGGGSRGGSSGGGHGGHGR